MKYNKRTVSTICNLLKAGNTRRTSAIAGGISEETFYVWMKSKPEFSESVKKAEAEAEARNVAIINQAGKTSWQASAWWLERRRKEDFGKQDRVDITTNGKDIRAMTMNELDAELERLRKLTSETD